VFERTSSAARRVRQGQLYGKVVDGTGAASKDLVRRAVLGGEAGSDVRCLWAGSG
jgi:hypothetical protein